MLVTREGHEVITSDLPKSVEEIEALMAKGRDEPHKLKAHG